MKADTGDTGTKAGQRSQNPIDPLSLAKIQELVKILSHERRLGGKDSAVIGGLDGYLARWRESIASLAANSHMGQDSVQLIAPLHDYALLPTDKRGPLLSTTIDGLSRLISSVGASFGGRTPLHDRTRLEVEALAGKRVLTPAEASTPGAPSSGVATSPGKTRAASSGGGTITATSGQSQSASAKKPVGAAPLCPPTPLADRNGLSTAKGSAPTTVGAKNLSPLHHGAEPVAATGPLDSPVTAIWGVSTATAARLSKLGVSTVKDLLYLFPRRHNDFSTMKTISELQPGAEETVMATIWEVIAKKYGKGGRPGVEIIIGDESGNMRVMFFNQPHMERILRPNTQVVLSGRVDVFRGQKVFQSPQWEILASDDLVHTGRIIPVYPLTEGLFQRSMRKVIKSAVDRWAPSLVDYLPQAIRKRAHLVDLQYAITQIHYPDSLDILAKAKERLAFDELFAIQLGALKSRRDWRESQPGHAMTLDNSLIDLFLSSLPFSLTGAQKRALDEILADQAKADVMSRLLQGEVGSGKTLVAAVALLVAVANGFQCVLLAPTEILAEQHFKTISRLYETFASLAAKDPTIPAQPVPRLSLLTGSLKKREKDAVVAALKDGQVDVLIGTHAVIQEGVEFNRLGLCIVDEQHRFGVLQRSAIRQKGFNPDVLVMTATPIPRTLALTIYGDLDISVIDELPPGRQEIKTRCLTADDRERAYSFIRKQIDGGQQAFIICPLVDESDKIEAKAAIAEYERLSKVVFPDLRLGLLHGRMKAAEKERAMQQFGGGELDILVSTTVVEVGIDVPNASVMLVEGADRFGLSQLHQLRGRVGRGAHQSYCILLADSPSAEARERLAIIEKTQDGFALAEEDMRLRGPGEFLGTRQSGLPDMKIAKLSDVRLIEMARREALALFSDDPDLAKSENRLLFQHVAATWVRVSDLS